MSNDSPRINGVALALIAAVIYTAGMGVVWLFAEHDYSETALLLQDVIFALAALVLVIVLLAWWSRLSIHRSRRLGRSGWLALVPVALILATFAASATSGITNTGLVLTVLVGTLLVGIGEETAFRGLVLNGLATRVTLPMAVLGSSVLFGLLHAVNVMLQSPGATVNQVLSTMVIGLFLGWAYVLTGGNLLLVIVIHWLWDFGLIASQVTQTPSAVFAVFGNIAMLVLAIAFSIYGFRKLRGMTWAQWSAQLKGAEVVRAV